MAETGLLDRIAQKIFGSRNDRLVKRLSRSLADVDGLEERLRSLSDEELKSQTAKLRARIDAGESVEALLPETFGTLREASRRAQNHRHFRCQLIGGKVLYDGTVAEMRTGEGKTIVCHLAAYLRVLQHQKVHIITVNDYLVKRDAEFAQPIFAMLDVTVGFIQSQQDPSGREGIRKAAYACDLTYGTNSEFGFDYLRDNMKHSIEEQVQGRLDYAIVDEVDSILIDEARTPLIISGPARDDPARYKWADNIARVLVRKQVQLTQETAKRVAEWGNNPPEAYKSQPKFDDAFKRFRVDPSMLTEDEAEALGHKQLYIVQRERKSVHVTHDGVEVAQNEAQIGSFYVGANMDRPHLIEQSLRAHVVYERDKEYVVQNREVIIVDEFTGRLMIGRQWSDGLHQAVEAKENVTIKEETQTLATITIQNYFKLYKNLAGMTGTAMTEANEFSKIYKLDVVGIPTNRPVNRLDHNDKVYRSIEAKYAAIVEEIHEVRRHGRPADPFLLAKVFEALRPILQKLGADDKLAKLSEAMRQFNSAEVGDLKVIQFMMDTYDECMGDMAVGRPVLVGTTSVENSEKLSKLLEHTYGIEHEVLNAKNHAREAEIVAKAGHKTVPAHGGDRTPLGNVTIATNMAGRGTDIKLSEGVVYPTCKVPASGSTSSSSNGSVASLAVVSNPLYPPGATKCCIHCAEYDPATNCAHCYKPKLDPRFPELGRKVCSINSPCGLHIVGTERHEARRIDNQLRGRAGRQGDPGSSRFFLSLEDDLLKLFMPDWMLKMMERLGLKEGASLEDRQLTKGIERAQRKVEERNFSTRKHLLEWDEPMDFQRKQFYRARQRILEGTDLRELIFEVIESAIDEAVTSFLARGFRAQAIADWCRSALDLVIDAKRFNEEDDLADVQTTIRSKAKDEARESIRTSLGEYIDPDEPSTEWDVGGLIAWAQRSYKVSMTQNQLRKLNPTDIEDSLTEAAEQYYDTVNLDAVEVYLDPNFPRRTLSEWVRTKFDIEYEPPAAVEVSGADLAADIKKRIREVYARREVTYPVEICLERAFASGQSDSAFAAQAVVNWANGKFRAGWNLDKVQGRPVEEVKADLLKLNESFLRGQAFEPEIQQALASGNGQDITEWGKKRFGRAWNPRLYEMYKHEPAEALRRMGHEVFRWELSRMEHAVLLHIYDQAWKDHLLEMDHLKHAIMQRPLGGDQSHPQSQYAIEGREFFDQMWTRIHERVTSMIFKVRMSGGPPAAAGRGGSGDHDGDGAGVTMPTRPTAPMNFQHVDSTGAGFGGAGADRDQAAAMRAQGQQAGKIETIRREQPKVGRNDPCPCGSGKKYKACHGRTA